MDSQRFYKWLCSEIGLSPKSARDVVSRVRRASRFIDLSLPVSDSELLFKMSESDEFKNLTMWVRSQLRRAVSLYRQFLATATK